MTVVPNLGSTDGSRGSQDLKNCITVNGRDLRNVWYLLV